MILKSNPIFCVNDKFQVCSSATGKVLSTISDKDGYLRVTYRKRDKTHHVAVHRAVAECFVENKNPSIFNIVNHIDGNVKNNHPSNLEWTDHSGNRTHAHVTGAHNIFGEAHSQTKEDVETIHRICKLLELGMRVCDIVIQVGCERHQINNIKSGKSWRSISSLYNLAIPRADTLSKSTIKWVKSQIDNGLDINEIARIAKRLTLDDIIRATKIIELGVCND